MKSSLKQPVYFHGKMVVVTGGTNGIGRAMVEQLLDAGARVATCGRSIDKLYSLQRANAGRPLHAVLADISKPADCEVFIQQAMQQLGPIDIIINNAGISMRAEFKEVSLKTMDLVMATNFMGAVHCTRHAMASIVERKGDIVAVSSIAGYRGLPGRSAYSASKWALRGWMESLRTELLDSGVNVICVSPGFTATNIRRTALNKDAIAEGETHMNEAALMQPDECAIKILNAVAARRRGLLITLQGWITVTTNTLFPKLADRLTRNYYYKNNELVK